MDLNNMDNELQNFKNSKRSLFDYEKYVKYSATKNNCKCLIKNCHQVLKGRVSGNIKRHYESVHHLIIYYRFFLKCDLEGDELQTYILKEDLRKYYDYYPLINKSFCKYLSCEMVLDGKDINRLIKHYEMEHNYDITNEEDNENDKEIDEHFLALKHIEDYDKLSGTYKCLFKNCIGLEVKSVEDIRKHYLAKHNIIATDTGLMKKLYKHTAASDGQEDMEEDFKELKQEQQPQSPKQASSESETDCYGEEEEEDKQTNNNLGNLIIPIKRTYRRTIHVPRFRFNDYVETFPEEKISKCLIESCHRILRGINANNTKRHYYSVHSMYILHGRRNVRTLEECELLLKSKYNDSFYYPLNHFVTKEKQNDLYKCIFKNCTNFMPKKLMPIKTHYQLKHNILIVKTTDLKIKRKTIDYDSLHKVIFMNHYENFNENNENEENDKEKPQTSKQIVKKPKSFKRKLYEPIISENYIHYEQEQDVAKCLLQTCDTLITNITSDHIKTHYLDKHQFIIYNPQDIPPFEDIKNDYTNFKFNEFLIESQCLFTNCREILPQNCQLIQKHYYEKHSLIIKTHKENKKLQYSAINQNIYNENQDNSYFLNNDYLNEEEFQYETYNHKYLTENIDDTQHSFNIKTENYQDDYDEYQDNEYTNITIDSYTINEMHQSNVNEAEISKEKQKFLKLCLSLIMKYDLPLEIFDDATVLKPLLAPYEEQIKSDINSKTMENVVIKVNHGIEEELKKCFHSKVVCLELYVVHYGGNNYLIFNIRFLEEETVQNKIIGYLTITTTTTILPISEYLNKFNIDEQQVYMKTILPTLQENDEIYKICDNLKKHNSDLKNHPLYELQQLFRSFIQDYSEDIENWQTISNYENKTNSIQNIKDFAKYIENLTYTNSELTTKLQNISQFFKTLQIFWNFYDKLSAEQYVIGDFYRDLLCCELELQTECRKNDNKYALKLNEKLLASKNSLLECKEFLAALYLDVRFNFLYTRLLNEENKSKAKLFLTEIWEKFDNFMVSTNSNEDPLLTATNNDNLEDAYALLDQHFNVNTNVSLQDKLTIWIPAKRQPFSLDILKYCRDNRKNLADIYELIKIVFTFSASHYIFGYLATNFKTSTNDLGKFDKFIIKFNENILEGQESEIFNDC